jgi:hypothetical protein
MCGWINEWVICILDIAGARFENACFDSGVFRLRKVCMEFCSGASNSIFFTADLSLSKLAEALYQYAEQCISALHRLLIYEFILLSGK